MTELRARVGGSRTVILSVDRRLSEQEWDEFTAQLRRGAHRRPAFMVLEQAHVEAVITWPERRRGGRPRHVPRQLRRGGR